MKGKEWFLTVFDGGLVTFKFAARKYPPPVAAITKLEATNPKLLALSHYSALTLTSLCYPHLKRPPSTTGPFSTKIYTKLSSLKPPTMPSFENLPIDVVREIINTVGSILQI